MDTRWNTAQNILLVRLDNVGDVILATPAIRAVRRARPSARLTLLASPDGSQVAGLVPDLDDVIAYSAPWMDPDHQLPEDPSREASTVALLRRRGFDGAIIFTSYHQSALPAAYLCYLASIPLRHAASVDGPGGLLTSRHRPPNRPMHEVERGLDLVGGLGFETDDRGLVLVPRQVDRHRARDLVKSVRSAGRPVVVIHPGCSCPSRTYPPEGFAAAANRLTESLGATIVWTGSLSEVGLVERIRSTLSDPGVSLAGRTSLAELAAVIEAVDVVLTNNTGPMHVAAAMKTPVVALFALTNPPQEWAPWQVTHRLLNHSVPCAICYQRACPFGHECLRKVTSEEILAAVADVLAESQTPAAMRSLAPFSLASAVPMGEAE